MKKKFDINIDEFLSPDFITLKLNGKTNLKENDTVNKYDEIIKGSLYSPISGMVSEIKDDYIVIANDFHEHIKKKKVSKKNIYSVKSEDIISLINKYSSININSNYKYLVLSLIDKDKYELTSKYLISKFTTRILETIDCLGQKLGIDNIFLVFKNNDEAIVTTVNNNVGTYPNIKVRMLTDSFGLGYKEILIPKIIHRDYNEEEVLFLDVNDVLSINNAIKNERPFIEKYITVSNMTKKIEKVMLVKVGTKVSELKEVMSYKDEDIIKNGLVCGYEIDKDECITFNTRSIFFAKENLENEKKCINCGLCKKLCPNGLNPKYIRTHNKADKSKCLHCGTCTYICPSKINFKPYLGDDYE